MSAILVLKAGREKAIRNRHHWIFSGAVQELSDVADGELVKVQSTQGETLGHAYVNRQSGILARLVSFGKVDPKEAILASLQSACELRKKLFGKETNAYRLVNSEGDGLPGLIIDRYAATYVLQISTLGMEKLKPLVLDFLQKTFEPVCIYEKSRGPARREEGLQEAEGLLAGKLPKTIQILENNLKFIVDLETGQKSGFYLDQREMRVLVETLAKGQRVLNCFAYSGGFSLYAQRGGAKQVCSVDISAPAMELARQNFLLNGYKAPKANFVTADVFQFLREQELNYDLLILDPPAFTKHKRDIVQACRGYKDLNRIALQKLPPKSYLLTCSCSYHVDEKLFQTVVFQAASEAGRRVRILQRHHLAPDHPINIYHPEGSYLKSLLLYVE